MDETKNKEIIGKSTQSAMGKQIDLKRNTKLNESISQKIIRNTMFNTIGRFWGILVALFLTPYIIGHIGVDRFGIWAIVGVLTGYFGLLDFGIGASFVKYISEFYAKEDYKKINQVVNTGLIFYAVFAVLVIISGFFIIKLLLNFFNIPPDLHSEALFVFLLGIVLFSISNALSVFGAVQTGLQRMDITNKIAIAISIPNIIGTIFFLERGYGLPGLMINNAIILAISSIINIIIAFRILPELRFNPLLVKKSMLKKLFRFGYKLQIVKLSSLAGPQTDKLLITHFLSLSLVGFYQLGNLFVEKAKGLSLLIVSALLPAVSELDAEDGIIKIKSLYIKAFKYVLSVTLPLSFFMASNARLIILTWMKQDFEKAVLALQILTVGFLVNTLTGPGAMVVQGMGKPEYHMKLSLKHLILNLTLSIILIIKFGFVGVLIGTCLSYFLTGSYFIYLVNKLLGISPIELGKTLFRPLLAILPAILFSYYFRFLFAPSGFGSSRSLNLGILLCTGLVLEIVFLLILLRTKYFDKEDLFLAKRAFLLLFHRR